MVAALVAVASAGAVQAEEKAREIAIVVNAELAVESATSDWIKKVFIGKTQRVESVRLIPINAADAALRDAFLGKYIDMTVSQYKSYWIKKVMSEGGAAPKSADDDAKMLSLVAENKGGVGYLWKDALPGLPKGVKILVLDK